MHLNDILEREMQNVSGILQIIGRKSRNVVIQISSNDVINEMNLRLHGL